MPDTKPEQDTSGIKEHLNSTPNILNYQLNKTNNYLILLKRALVCCYSTAGIKIQHKLRDLNV